MTTEVPKKKQLFLINHKEEFNTKLSLPSLSGMPNLFSVFFRTHTHSKATELLGRKDVSSSPY